MRSRKIHGSLAIAASASLALAACGGAGGPQSGGSSGLSDGKVVIGLLNDQSGVYKDVSGPNSGVAIQMAIDDYKAKYGDKAVAKTIELVQADHQNKADIANSKAQEMYDRQKADVILDVPNSAAALAVATQAANKKKLYINISAGTTALTGAKCNKYTFHWAYNTGVLARGTAGAITKGGGTTWNIVYPDYAFGQDMNKSFTAQVQAAGGTVGQSIASPFPSDNFATFLTKAGEGNPKVVGSMHAGGDLINFVKQFNQSPLKGKVTLAVGLMFITDIHSLGLDQFAGTQFTDAWYWNFDAQNRAWADRFKAKTNVRPSFANAANYSAAMNYLEAVQAAGTDNADKIVAQLEGKKINDVFLRNGEVRKADHAVVHDVYLAKVKSSASEDWDYEEILKTIPAAEAYGPANPACKLG
ncbi:branched-chain amino acid ABC transporter substrate-binding protein [Intrasporangium oryzae NRRL B-24470]|uniref:Branched-chain amino acid ABC transporter substrate-binding protein n=1 Tax=Intrasporangium oryzae NRRL B-24470 TaxID=1386089 RepID=W9G870_9MICO|nr:ABC transporter substrate-binding protein [Intrasporangium oryzae]EWT02245.1 branched-chain amino acid ABC transporter substrate-binding protein [Intrasporangium oryzae NRRL B-24470]